MDINGTAATATLLKGKESLDKLNYYSYPFFFFTIIQNLSCTYENNKHNTILIYFLVIPCGLRYLAPSPGIELAAMAVKALSPNHWTTREVPIIPSLF